MTVTVHIKAIELVPGSAITISALSWQEFEDILVELGEQRRVGITYYQGKLEIMSPLALTSAPTELLPILSKQF